MSKPTRLAAFTLALTSAAVAPLLAMDKKLNLPLDLFKDITSKNFKDKKAGLVAGVKLALDGKMGKDASSENVKTVLDALEGIMPESMDESVSEEQQKAMEAAAGGESNLGIPQKVGEEFADKDKGKSFDSAPLMNFLKEKGMGEDDLKMIGDMLPSNGLAGDEDEDDEAKAKAEADAKAKKEKEGAMDDVVTKPAMDAALKAQADHFNKEITSARAQERGVHVARAHVRAWVGEIPATMAFDSAADVYRHALIMKGVAKAKDLHADALLPILENMPKAGAKAPEATVDHLAMDSSVVSKAIKLAPGLEHISPAV